MAWRKTEECCWLNLAISPTERYSPSRFSGSRDFANFRNIMLTKIPSPYFLNFIWWLALYITCKSLSISTMFVHNYKINNEMNIILSSSSYFTHGHSTTVTDALSTTRGNSKQMIIKNNTGSRGGDQTNYTHVHICSLRYGLPQRRINGNQRRKKISNYNLYLENADCIVFPMHHVSYHFLVWPWLVNVSVPILFHKVCLQYNVEIRKNRQIKNIFPTSLINIGVICCLCCLQLSQYL